MSGLVECRCPHRERSQGVGEESTRGCGASGRQREEGGAGGGVTREEDVSVAAQGSRVNERIPEKNHAKALEQTLPGT